MWKLNGCPNDDVLREFSSGRLAEEDRHSVAEHLQVCSKCVELFPQIRIELPLRQAAASVSADLDSLESDTCETLIRADNSPESPLQIRDYEFLELIGRGGIGAVYRARHTKLKREVAIKVLAPDRCWDPDAVARFEREMEAVGRLDHPHIVRATDAGVSSGQHFLVMELVAGSDLNNLVKRRGRLPVAAACELIRQAALGLQYAHEQKMVHRDIKPSNMILARAIDVTGRPVPAVKILDFGLALLITPKMPLAGNDLTSTHQVMGTADYMAPEQWNNSHTVDIRADLYSLGCTLFHLLVGRPPFATGHQSWLEKMEAHSRDPFPPLAEFRSDVPESLAGILEKLVAKDPEQRYATPRELAEAIEPYARNANLEQLLAHASPALASTERFVPPMATSPGRRRFLQRAAMVFGALICLSSSAYLLNQLQLGWDHKPATNVLAPPQFAELRLFVKHTDQPLRYESLVSNGQVLPAPPVTLASNDGFQLDGVLSREAYWYVVWFDTAGRVAVEGKSEEPTKRVEYPQGNLTTVNSADPLGVHMLLIVVSDRAAMDIEQQLVQQLAPLGAPPQFLPQGFPGQIRGAGEDVARDSTPLDFVRAVRDHLPEGSAGIHTVFLQTVGDSL